MSEEKNTTRTERGARILEELKAKAASSDTASKAEVKEEKPEPPAREARPVHGRTSRRGGARRGSSRRQRRREKESDATPKSKAPLFSAIAGIAIIGGGAIWWFAFRGNTPENTEAKLPETITEAAPEPELPIVEVQAPAPPPEVEEESAVEEVKESTLSPEEPSQPPPSAAFTAPGPGETIEYKGITELAILDLTLVPSLPKWDGSSDEDWGGD